MDWNRLYIPEIHDVHPGMAADLDELVALFPAPARVRIGYLIVPNWQGRYPLDADPGFAARLAGLPGTRILHGWTHSKGPDLMNWLLYGHDDRSEFAGLSAAETARRLGAGLAMLTRALGAAPVWFCAPRWQQNPALASALWARSFVGNLTRGHIARRDGRPVPMPAINFDEGARALKIAAGLAVRQVALPRLLRSGRPFRLALHPDDLHRPRTLRQIKGFIAALDGAGWRAISVEDAAARWEGQA